MDDFHQSTALTARRRRLASGRRLLGLMALALVLLLPGRALADRPSAVLWQPADAGAALAYDVTSEDQPPADPAPADPATESDEPAPAPSDPAPSDPPPSDPAPSEPAPDPSDPAPAPSDPAPAPSEPAPAPSEPAPAPSDPAPPADEVPIDSAPAPSEPAPRDGRETTPKPPASEERQLPSTAPTTTTVAPVAPTTSTSSTPAGADRTGDPAKPASGRDDRSPTRVVRAAFERLGLGTIAAPTADDGGTPTATVLAQACTPIGTVAAEDAPQVGNGLTSRSSVRTHRADDEPPTVRGPPAPLDSPTSPIATAAAASAGTGGASGDRDCAILAKQIVFTLADAGRAVATERCGHLAPAPANAAARAPPVV